MKIISNKSKLKKFIHYERNLGFVPTMGAIHMGHISLINKSLDMCNKTIVSIFINKPQFNKKHDFRTYPRSLKRDIRMLKKLKIDYLYIPKTNQIYPKGENKKIIINSFKKKLCGKFRPGHFEAVCDVLDRFVKIINPRKIFLGEKDYQQLILVKDYMKKINSNIKVIGCKTIREKNGMAYSSRNFLLSQNEKIIGSKIYNLLKKNKKNVIKKRDNIKKIKRIIYNFGVDKIEYLRVLNINNLIKPFNKKGKKYKIFISYYLGKIRLIDNI